MVWITPNEYKKRKKKYHGLLLLLSLFLSLFFLFFINHQKMGNANSRPSDEVLATLSTKNKRKYDLSYPNYFESSKALGTEKLSPRGSMISMRREKRKQSSASEDSIQLNADGSFLSASPPSTSLVSSNEYNIPLEYEIKNGRRYMVSSAHRFYLPCDDIEADRIIVLHFCIQAAFNGNIVAPVIPSLGVKPKANEKYSARVLDVGCGPGTWILEMATDFPFTEFHGIDIRTMFPTTIKPPNAQFTQHDFLQSKFPYSDSSFDFVRMRLMISFITEPQLLHLLSEIHRILKPDGYFEVLDCEYQIQRPGLLCAQIINREIPLVLQNRLGTVKYLPSHDVSTNLTLHGGFVNVYQHLTHIPIGWGGKLGEVHAQNLIGLLTSIHPDIKQDLTVLHDGKDVDDLIVQAVNECAVQRSHVKWFVCYGQKPTSSNLAYQPETVKKTPTTTPKSSPSSSCVEVKESKGLSMPAWDSFYDFVAEYSD
ncbi:S-adenosyl-L-methionine-dependent methyltransferase [Parasitella parasitica]|nr:S-adenosyl-L-methionine-dependent methyltransferase [Parasitella parasitica]